MLLLIGLSLVHAYDPSWTLVDGTLNTIEACGIFACGTQTDSKQLWCSDMFSFTNLKPEWKQYLYDWVSVDCGGGHITGSNGAFGVYTNAYFGSNDFTAIAADLKQVAVSEDGAGTCGVTALGDVYCADNTLRFNQLKGALTHVTVSGSQVYGVDGSGAIWYTPDFNHFDGWTSIPGILSQIDFDGDSLCGVTPGHDVMCALKGLPLNPEWENFQTPDDKRQFSHVSVHGVVLAGTGTDGRIYTGTNRVISRSS
jgi:hypothetical protein